MSDETQDMVYLLRRLREANRAKALPAESRVNLAMSPLDDDELEEVVEMFTERPDAV